MHRNHIPFEWFRDFQIFYEYGVDFKYKNFEDLLCYARFVQIKKVVFAIEYLEPEFKMCKDKDLHSGLYKLKVMPNRRIHATRYLRILQLEERLVWDGFTD